MSLAIQGLALAQSTINLNLTDATVAGVAPSPLFYGGYRYGVIGDAVFLASGDNSGSGVWRRLYKVQNSGTESGYNREVSGFNSQIPMGFDPIIRVSDLRTSLDGNYYVFALDVGEDGDKLISLDEVRIYTGSSTDPSPLPSTLATLGQLGTLRYSMDAENGGSVILKSASGNGSNEMYLLVPTARFAGAASTDMVYLYSSFGGLVPSGGSFEEWSLPPNGVTSPIPEPGTAIVVMVAFSILVVTRRRHFGHATR